MNISFLFHIDGIPCRYPPYKAREIFKQFGFINNYVSPDDLPNLDSEYGNIQGTTVYGSDVRETNAAVFNGGYVRPDKIAVQTPYLANFQFGLANLQTFGRGKVPWKRLFSNVWAIPFQGIHGTLWDSAVAPNMISPSSVYGGNPWEFTLLSDKTVHVHLKGSISIYVRVNKIDSDQELTGAGYTEMTLPAMEMTLRSDRLVPAERSQEWLLASEAGDDLVPMKFRGDKTFAMPQLSYDELKEKMKDVVGYKFDYVRGSILPRDITAGWGNNFTNHQMTSWFNIGVETQFIIEVDRSSSTTLRIQWLLNDGRVVYDDLQSNTIPATVGSKVNKIISIPPKALRCRIFFSYGGRADGTEPTSIVVKPVPIQYDPYYGVWVKYNLNVDWMGPLHPGCNYGFRAFFKDLERVGLDKDGFIITSSVLSMQMNVKDALQTALNIALIDSNIGEN